MEAGGYYESLKKSLREQKLDEGANSDNRLYIDRHYAVRIISPGIYNHQNIPLVILENLVETLNHTAKVPHTIVLAMNDRKFWNDKVLLNKEMAWILKKNF